LFDLIKKMLNMSASFCSASLQGLLQTEVQHSVVEVDESQFKTSTSGVTKEEVEATNASHEQGTSTTTSIRRHALCLPTLRCMLTVYNFLHMSQKATVY